MSGTKQAFTQLCALQRQIDKLTAEIHDKAGRRQQCWLRGFRTRELTRSLNGHAYENGDEPALFLRQSGLFGERRGLLAQRRTLIREIVRRLA